MDVYATFYISLCISCKLLNKKSGIDDYFRAFLLDVRLIFIPETLRELRASKIVNKESFTLYYYLQLLFKIQESSDNDKYWFMTNFIHCIRLNRVKFISFPLHHTVCTRVRLSDK